MNRTIPKAKVSKSAIAKKQSKPGPGRPTREQAEQRRLELLDVALKHFAENGFERTTIEGIAAAVGMAKRTVYALYGSKIALFKTSLEHAINAWIVPVEALRAAETDDLEETLLRIGHILVQNIMTPEGLRLLRITNAEANSMPEISTYTYRTGTGPTLDYLSDLFTRRVKRNGKKIADVDEAALAFLYLIVGGPANLLVWGIPMDEKEINRHTRYCVHLFLHGLASDGVESKTARRRA